MKQLFLSTFLSQKKDEAKNLTEDSFILMIMMQAMASKPVGVQHLLPFLLDNTDKGSI